MGLLDIFKKPQAINQEDELIKSKTEKSALESESEEQEDGLEQKIDRLGGGVMDEAQKEAENTGKLTELVGDGEDASFLKRLQDTYEVVNHRFESFSKSTGARLERAEEKIGQKWAGRALLGLKNIAAIPLQFTTDVIMAGVKSVKNKMTANELSGLLSGEDGPEKLFELMGIDRQSEEGQVIKELLRDEKKRELALDTIAKSLARSSHEALIKKTKFTDYLSLDNPETPKGGQEARTRLEIIYLKNKINPQDYEACRAFEAELQQKDPAKYEELKALTEAVIETGKKDQPGKSGPWDFSNQGTSLMQKANIALASAKNGMLWHMLKDPREIAGLATCTINGEYIHNLATFDLKETLKAGKTQDAMMRDLLLLQNIDKFEEPMQKQIQAQLKVAGNRMALLKDQASAGGYTLKNYGKKQLDTMAYLTMRATGGIAMDMFKYATGKHKESVLAAEVGNSGLAEDYAKLLSGLEKNTGDSKEKDNRSMESANEFGFRLMNLDKGGAVIAVKDLVDRLLVKNSQGGKVQEEEMAFLEKMSGFVQYQMSKGRVDIGQVNQVKQLVDRYKMESRSVSGLDEAKLEALRAAGYNPSSYASKKTGDWLKDFFIKDEKHAAFVNRNSGNIIFDYLGYQADRLASLGSHQGVEFGGAISLEHHLLENVSGVTTAALSQIPGVGGAMGDMYSAAKAATMTAGKIMSFDFLTGEQLGKPHAVDKAAAPEAGQLEALKSQIGQAELFKNLNSAINGEAIVEQINQARQTNEQMSEVMVKEVGSFLQAQIPGLTAALAGGAAIMILKNPALLMKTLQGTNIKNLGKLLDSPALRSIAPFADDVAMVGFGSPKSAFAEEKDLSKLGKNQAYKNIKFADVNEISNFDKENADDVYASNKAAYETFRASLTKLMTKVVEANESKDVARLEAVRGEVDKFVKTAERAYGDKNPFMLNRVKIALNENINVLKNPTVLADSQTETRKGNARSDVKGNGNEQAPASSPVGGAVKTADKPAAPEAQKGGKDTDYELQGGSDIKAYEIKLGEDGVPAELERVFTSLAMNKLQLNEQGPGKENDKVTARDASRALNMGANLVKLIEKNGKGKVAGVSAEEFNKVCSYDAKTGKLDIKDRAGFEKVLGDLETNADNLWENGKLKAGAAKWIGNIKQATWLDIAQGKGLNEGFVEVDENGKEIGGQFGMIKGHEGLAKDDIEKFQKYEHKVIKTSPVKVENKEKAGDKAPAAEEKPPEKKADATEIKSIDESVIELSEDEFKVLEEMKAEEAKAATDGMREAVDADMTASTGVNIDKIKEMKVSDVLATDGKDRISAKLKGPYDNESSSNQNTEKQAEETIKLAKKAAEYFDPEENEKMESFTKRLQEQVTIAAIEQSRALKIDTAKVPLKEQVKVLRSYGKAFEQIKDYDQKINLMKILSNPLDKEALLKFTHFDKLGKDSQDYKDVRAEKLRSNGDLEITFVTKDNFVNVDMIVSKAGKIYVDGFGSNNWGDKNHMKELNDASLNEGLKFVYEKGVGENRKINEKEFAVAAAPAAPVKSATQESAGVATSDATSQAVNKAEIKTDLKSEVKTVLSKERAALYVKQMQEIALDVKRGAAFSKYSADELNAYLLSKEIGLSPAELGVLKSVKEKTSDPSKASGPSRHRIVRTGEMYNNLFREISSDDATKSAAAKNKLLKMLRSAK